MDFGGSGAWPSTQPPWQQRPPPIPRVHRAVCFQRLPPLGVEEPPRPAASALSVLPGPGSVRSCSGGLPGPLGPAQHTPLEAEGLPGPSSHPFLSDPQPTSDPCRGRKSGHPGPSQDNAEGRPSSGLPGAARAVTGPPASQPPSPWLDPLPAPPSRVCWQGRSRANTSHQCHPSLCFRGRRPPARAPFCLPASVSRGAAELPPCPGQGPGPAAVDTITAGARVRRTAPFTRHLHAPRRV